MSATITWVIEWMNCLPTDGSRTNVVVTAGWRCNGVQIDGSDDTAKTYNTTVYGSASFAEPAEGGDFTPYASLTKDQVLAWVWANGVDQAAIEAGIQANLDAQITPAVIQPALPWSA